MITLALDTSTPLGGLCLYSKEKGILGEIRLGVTKTHSEGILAGIDFLLKASKITLHDVDFLTLTIGPGSFTGLRVGLSTVKGLAFSTGLNVVAVPTLRAFAYSLAFFEYLLCPLIDARKKEIYGAAYQWKGDDLIEVVPERVCSIEDFLKGIKGRAIFAGSGAVLYRKRITELSKDAVFVENHHNSIIPTAIAIYGLKEAEKGNFADPIRLTPLYIRKSEAELNFTTLKIQR